jgi:hypothetical protein
MKFQDFCFCFKRYSKTYRVQEDIVYDGINNVLNSFYIPI